MLNDEEFFDAVDATLDKLEKEEEKVCHHLSITLLSISEETLEMESGIIRILTGIKEKVPKPT